MAEPYQTSCVDFKPAGYLSRYDNITKCEAENYNNEYHRQHMNYDLNNDLFIDSKNLNLCKIICGNNRN